MSAASLGEPLRGSPPSLGVDDPRVDARESTARGCDSFLSLGNPTAQDSAGGVEFCQASGSNVQLSPQFVLTGLEITAQTAGVIECLGCALSDVQPGLTFTLTRLKFFDRALRPSAGGIDARGDRG